MMSLQHAKIFNTVEDPERADSASKSAQIPLASLLPMPLSAPSIRTKATVRCVRFASIICAVSLTIDVAAPRWSPTTSRAATYTPSRDTTGGAGTADWFRPRFPRCDAPPKV